MGEGKSAAFGVTDFVDVVLAFGLGDVREDQFFEPVEGVDRDPLVVVGRGCEV